MRTLLIVNQGLRGSVRLLPWKPQLIGGLNQLIGHVVVLIINRELMGHFVFIMRMWKLACVCDCVYEVGCKCNCIMKELNAKMISKHFVCQIETPGLHLNLP